MFHCTALNYIPNLSDFRRVYIAAIDDVYNLQIGRSNNHNFVLIINNILQRLRPIFISCIISPCQKSIVTIKVHKLLEKAIYLCNSKWCNFSIATDLYANVHTVTIIRTCHMQNELPTGYIFFFWYLCIYTKRQTFLFKSISFSSIPYFILPSHTTLLITFSHCFFHWQRYSILFWWMQEFLYIEY